MRDIDKQLMHAADNGRVDECKNLLAAGADVNVVDDETGYMPLHTASYAECPETCRVLIEAGADVNAFNSYTLTPLHYCTKERTFISLVEAGADPCIVPKGATCSYLTPLQTFVKYHNSNEFDDAVHILNFCVEKFGVQVIEKAAFDDQSLLSLNQANEKVRSLLLSLQTQLEVEGAIAPDDAEQGAIKCASGMSPL